MMDIHINEVRLTDEYDKFKELQGNRDVCAARAAKILESIQKVGFINGPIIVNEHFEVIDGKGRLEVCRTNGIPVPYIIIEGIGIDECISMNINQSNWKTTDYIKAYADLGRPDYIRFQTYLRANSNRPNGLRHGINILNWVAFHSSLRNYTEKIKRGELVFTQTNLARANKMLDYFDLFNGVKTNNPGCFFSAIGYCTFFDEVDKDRLVKVAISAKPHTFEYIGSIEDALGTIEEVYNYRKNPKIHIKVLYSDYLNNKTLVGAANKARREKKNTFLKDLKEA